MGQDACGADVGHGQTWLGDAHRQDGSWLPLAEPWEAGREGGKASCGENGDIEFIAVEAETISTRHPKTQAGDKAVITLQH